MKNNLKKATLIFAMAGLLAGCQTSVSESNEEKTENVTEQTQSAETKKEESGEAAGIESESAYGKTINFGFPGALCHTAAPLAKELGYFDEEGLDINIIKGVNAVESTGTGQTDVATTHIAHALVPAANGTDLEFFETTQTGCQSLLVPEDSPIQSTKDLVGKNIGLPNGIGSPDHNIVIRFLIRDGIDVNDVNWVPVEISTATEALNNGELDACLMPEMYSKKFRDGGDLRVIRSITYDDDFTNEPCCVYILNGEWAEENPLHAEKIEKVIKRVNKYIDENMEEAAKKIVEADLAAGDYDLVLENMKEYHWVVGDDVLEDTLINVIDDYKKGHVLADDVDTKELMDQIFIPMN